MLLSEGHGLSRAERAIIINGGFSRGDTLFNTLCRPITVRRPLDTRSIIKTQEKSTSAPHRGHGKGIFTLPRRGSSFSI